MYRNDEDMESLEKQLEEKFYRKLIYHFGLLRDFLNDALEKSKTNPINPM